MRLVLIYSVSDDYTYSYDVVLPVEAESKEQLYCLLKDGSQKAHEERRELKLFGHDFSPSDFWRQERLVKVDGKGRYREEWTERQVFLEPEILTVDEWFDRHGGV